MAASTTCDPFHRSLYPVLAMTMVVSGSVGGRKHPAYAMTAAF
jgi:hypothetical protein